MRRVSFSRGRMRQTHALIVATAVGAMLLTSTPYATAINGGVADTEGRYRNVVCVFVVVFEGCATGQLVAPRLVLTAAHVLGSPADELFVTNDLTVPAGADTSKMIPVTAVFTHPDFSPASFANDVGILELGKAVKDVPLVQLPTEELLDELKSDGLLKTQAFTGVGYGAVADCSSPPCTITFDDTRRVAAVTVISLGTTWVQAQINPQATEGGGFCTGDSGAPLFVGDSYTSVGVLSFGGGGCHAVMFLQRLDTRAVRDFLDDFVPVP